MWRIGILISLALTSLPGLASDNFPLFEKDRTGWALYVDNDLIADGSKDQEFVRSSSFVPKALLNAIAILRLLGNEF